jgi:hypothetical protein
MQHDQVTKYFRKLVRSFGFGSLLAALSFCLISRFSVLVWFADLQIARGNHTAGTFLTEGPTTIVGFVAVKCARWVTRIPLLAQRLTECYVWGFGIFGIELLK